MSQPETTNPEPEAPIELPANAFLQGERIRRERERIAPYSSKTGSLSFTRETKTHIRGIGQFETSITTPSIFLPEGTRVSKAEDITHVCSKYQPRKNVQGCGPLTKERVYWCQRCKRPYCARHTWQALFSANRYCWACFSIRGAELALKCIGGLLKGVALIIAWFVKAWMSLFTTEKK